ncbi:hypothetical protein STENM36S_03522 [Streptomyces tendae]
MKTVSNARSVTSREPGAVRPTSEGSDSSVRTSSDSPRRKRCRITMSRGSAEYRTGSPIAQ